ncbi:MAG: glycosyltransferase family 39 protein [Deltaproteobacteria bacterium]|nr:glycosyltransferase family 39 protein [Deltaproteobacteria bacterium]
MQQSGWHEGEPGPRAGALALPLALGLLTVAVYGLYFSQDLGAGSPRHYDAYYTLIRSIGFLDTGDWLAVHRNTQPDFRKPPLQYMLTALSMKAGMDDMLALRLWPFVFALGTLLGTLLLARLIAPYSPWAMPSAVLLLASSRVLAGQARMGLLETGMACFLVLSLCALFLAERDSRWWIAAGTLVGLGFLQKAPVALAASALGVTALCWLPGERAYSWAALRRSRDFRIGGAIALGLCAFWPLVQVLRFGPKYLKVQYLWQMIYRFHPHPPAGAGGVGPEPLRWLEWLRFDSPMVWLTCLALLGVALLTPRFRRNGKLFLVALYVGVVIAALAVAGGEVYPRYIVVLTPFLAVVGGVVLAELVPWRRPLAGGVAAVLFATNLPALAQVTRPSDANDADRMATARLFREALAEDETPIFFYSEARRLDYPPPAFLYYADLDRRVAVFNRVGLRQLGPAKARQRLRPPYQGIAHRDDYAMVGRYLGPLVEVGRHGEHVIWKSAGRDRPPGGNDPPEE